LYDAHAASVAIRTGATPEVALAVLAFTRESTNHNVGHLGAALADEIAARLYRLERTIVRRPGALRRTAALSPAAMVTLGRQVGARYVLAGTIDVRDGFLIVVPRLYRATDGSTEWTTRYERPLSAVATIEQEISRELGSRLGVSLSPEQTSLLTRPRTQNAEAYDHFLRGSFYLSSGTTADAVRAISELERAVTLDGTFAAAHARLGIAYATVLQAGRQLRSANQKTMLARGTSVAQRALAIDSSSVEAWLARAAILAATSPRSYEGVRGAYARAVATDPRSAEALRLYGRALMHLGSFQAAEVRLRSAVELDPQSARALYDLADLEVIRRRPSDACRLLNGVLQNDPRSPRAYALRAALRHRWGEVRDAWADAETASRLGDRLWGESAAALVDAQAKDTTGARARLLRLSRQTLANVSVLSPEDARLPALAFTALGDTASARNVLERARPRGAALWAVLQDPGFDRARSLSWFRSLVQTTRSTTARD
jgi:TolB-like protein/Flp pilus assembly protein TadD